MQDVKIAKCFKITQNCAGLFPRGCSCFRKISNNIKTIVEGQIIGIKVASDTSNFFFLNFFLSSYYSFSLIHLPLSAKMDAVKTTLVLTVERATRDVMSMVNGFHANVD